MRIRRIVLLAALAVVCFGTNLTGQEGNAVPVQIEWGTVPGARGYVLQIRGSGKAEATTLRSTKTKVSVQLAPGDYERRVAALNRFHRTGAWSDWAPLRVRLTREPEILEVSPNTVRAGTFGLHRIHVRGRDFLPGMRVTVRNADRTLTIVESKSSNGESLDLLVDATGATEGGYEVVLVNPGNQESRKPEALLLTHQPEVEVVAKRELPATDPTERASTQSDISGIVFGSREESQPATEKPAPRTDTAALLPKKEESQPSSRRSELPLWQSLVPGLPQMVRGDTGRAWLLWGTIGAVTVGGTAAWFGAEMKAGSAGNTLLFQTFNNPIAYLGVRDSLAASPLGLLMYAAGRREFSKSADRYHRSQRLAAGAAGAVIVVYALHLLDAFGAPKPANSAPARAASGTDAGGVQVLFGLGPQGRDGRAGTLGVQVKF